MRANGSCGGGICISCAADLIGGKEKLVERALGKASKQIHDLFAKHKAEIYQAYVASDDGKLSIGLSAKLAPSLEMPDTIVVRCKINFVESRCRDQVTASISMQEKLAL